MNGRIATFAFILLAPLAATAAQRTFVSTSGLDANTALNCSLTAPCRGFNAALSVTDANGEVVVLDSGGYGAAAITKGVSIQAPAGLYAGVSVFSGDGITVNAPGATVNLQGLGINGLGGVNGVNVTAVGTLRIERCTITNMSGNGIMSTAAGATVQLTDVRVANSGVNGVTVDGGASFVAERLLVDRSTADGLRIFNVVDTVVTSSTFSRNTLLGVRWQTSAAMTEKAVAAFDRVVSAENGSVGLFVSPQSTAGATASVAITRSTVTRNAFGTPTDSIRFNGVSAGNYTVSDTLVQGGGSYGIGVIGPSDVLTVANSTIVGNASEGFRREGGTFYTRGTNTLRGNAGLDITGQTVGTITPLGGG